MRDRAPRESSLEDELRRRAKELGGVALKIAPLSCVGLPDRLVLLPGGRLGFLELKRAGQEPSATQRHWLARLAALGFVATWAASRADLDAFFSLLA